MKGTRRSKVWLALAAVVAACLVLAGCPHNNLLDNSGSGGGNGAGGGRGGNGEVKLIVTNFQSEAPPAGRIASWLAGPSKSLAPDHIDLKNNSADYVFVVTADGLNGEKYGPAYITLDAQGVTSLGIPDSGTWKIKVSAYEAAKLNGQPDITGSNSQDIMAQTTDVSKVVAVDDALVLQGEATLDLGVSSTGIVVVTLTNDKVEGDGGVQLDVYFDDAGDRQKLDNNGGADYSVTVALYDFVTGAMVGLEDEIKVLNATLANPDKVSIANVAKGRYQFRVTVKNKSGNPVAYYADDITIEGNRNVTQEVRVPKLFDTPAAPTAAGVYWSPKDAGEARDGFLAYLSWEGVPYNAVGMDVQIADITQWYENGGGQDQVNFAGTGAQNINNANDLWTEIEKLNDGTTPKFDDVVTELSWRDSPQKATRFPAIYKDGSLLNGEPGIVLLMQTGHIYSVRVRSSGATDTSDWVVIDQTSTDTMVVTPKMLDTVPGATTPGPGPKDANKFNNTKLAKGLFDLVKLEYDLQGKYELYKATNGAGVQKGDAATADDLVKYSPYGQDIEIALRYADMEIPKEGDWFLYPMGSTSIDQRSKGWKGWKGVEDPIKEFNATVGQVTTNWGSYSGHSNLTLVPVGAGAGFQMQSETADTFNVLTDTTVLVDIMDNNGDPVLAEIGGGTHGNDTVKNTGMGLHKDGARYILSLDYDAKGRAGGTATWLFVSAGKDPAHVGTLGDQNGNDFTVVDIKATILQNGLTKVKTFNTKDGHTAYAQLDGMASGNYTLRVEVKADSGYWVSYSTPLVIKYDTQTITP